MFIKNKKDYVWLDAQQGNADMFAKIYAKHVDVLYAFNLKKLSWNHDDTADIVAESFLILWRDRKGFDIKDNNCLPLLYGITANLRKNLFRSKYKHISSSEEELDNVIPHEDNFVDTLIANQELGTQRSNLRKKAHDLLSEKEKEIYLMVFVENMKYKAISEKLSIPIGTVKSRVNTIKNKLKQGVYN